MSDEGVRLKAAADLEAAEQQIELLRAQIAEHEQHAEDVRRFLALYQQYQPAGNSQPASDVDRLLDPSDNLVMAAFGGRDR